MADDGDRHGGWAVFFGSERATEDGMYSQHGKQVCRDLQGVHVFRIAGAADRASPIGPRCKGQRSALAVDVREIRVRTPPELAHLFASAVQRDEAFGVGIDERS